MGKVICWVLGTASNAALASGEAALWYRARDDGVGVMAAVKSEFLDAWWPWRRRCWSFSMRELLDPVDWSNKVRNAGGVS